MMRDWNLEVRCGPAGAWGAAPAAPLCVLAGRYLFWGGVVAWPGLFAMLAVYFGVYCAAPGLRSFLLGRARLQRPWGLRSRRRFALALFGLYLMLCCAWTWCVFFWKLSLTAP